VAPVFGPPCVPALVRRLVVGPAVDLRHAAPFEHCTGWELSPRDPHRRRLTPVMNENQTTLMIPMIRMIRMSWVTFGHRSARSATLFNDQDLCVHQKCSDVNTARVYKAKVRFNKAKVKVLSSKLPLQGQRLGWQDQSQSQGLRGKAKWW